MCPYCLSQVELGLLLLIDKGILIHKEKEEEEGGREERTGCGREGGKEREKEREIKMAGKLPKVVWS